MLKYVLIFFLFATVDGSFHLYNTDVSDTRDYRDCLYSFTLNNFKNEWQLVPYCIRHNVPSADDNSEQCYGNANYTFEQLKSKNVDSHHLYKWNAPIDTINDYQKYRAGHGFSFGSHRYCNCSGKITVHISSCSDVEMNVSSWLVWYWVSVFIFTVK
jgi:hypothetical protein